MRTLLHVTTDDEGDFRHAIRSAALLRGHDEPEHEDVTLPPIAGEAGWSRRTPRSPTTFAS